MELIEKAPGNDNLLAKFSAKAWGAGADSLKLFESRTGQKFTNNIQVIIKVKIEYHSVRGLQLDITSIDPNFTLGVLEQQCQSTLERLCRENPQFIQKRGEEYRTKNKSLTLPLVIQRIAIVFATGSAGWQDFQHTLLNNPYGYGFDMIPFFTGVQGEANASVMRETLIAIYRSPVPVDIVVMIRGGGAQTDFLIFDHYLVGQAIARFPIPVLTGIGHQKNISIADLMSHTLVKTPTKAAEFIISYNRRFEERLITMRQNVLVRVQQALSVRNAKLGQIRNQVTNQAHQLLSVIKQRLSIIQQVIIGEGRAIPYQRQIELTHLTATLLSQPKIIIASKQGDLRNSIGNIKVYQETLIKNSKGYLNHFVSILKIVSPENTLKRGFAIIKHHRKIISDPAQLANGDQFSVILKDQDLQVELKNQKNYDGK